MVDLIESQTMELSRRSLLLSAWFFRDEQNSTFSSEVKVVTLFAAVRNAAGQSVSNLSREDFSLEEDGRPQNIRYFARESDLALTIGLLVDTSRSELHVLETERRASFDFLDKVLRPDRDRAFVAHFDMRFGVLQGLTSSRKELADALGRLRIPSFSGTLLYTGLSGLLQISCKDKAAGKRSSCSRMGSIIAAGHLSEQRSNTRNARTRLFSPSCFPTLGVGTRGASR